MAASAVSRLSFPSPEEEVRFLRGLLSVQRLADEVLEDCIERGLGLEAALDVFLSQCARMMHARAAFVVLSGSQGPVLTRVWGERVDPVALSRAAPGMLALGGERTGFVQRLTLGRLELGAVGFVLEGRFDEPAPVLALVEAVAELLDTAVLSFVALADGLSAVERLEGLSRTDSFRPAGRIGRYELVQPLGTGGMAQVMVARSTAPGGVSRLVALKRILPSLVDDEAIVQQFLDEARLGMLLSHPNLVTLYDFGKASGNYFIAMELVKGVDFDRVIYAPFGPLAPELIAAVLVQALAGMHAAHDTRGEDGAPLGLVHRDLSPHNIVVGFDGRVKVLDFGVAKMRNQRTVTLPGIVKGKPLYMSPEQATAERIDRRSDVFSMGLILYEACMGHRAFDKKDDTRTMEAIVGDPLPRPEGFPAALWPVADRALQKAPERRFRSCDEMAQAIREAVSPLSDHELGRIVAERFPRRVQEVQAWERTGSRSAAQTVDD